MLNQKYEPAFAPLLSVRDVTSLLGISRCTLWRLERAGRFPAAIVVGPKMKRWRRAEIEAYLSNCAAAV